MGVVRMLVCDGGYMVWVLLGCWYVMVVTWSGFC